MNKWNYQKVKLIYKLKKLKIKIQIELIKTKK